MEKLLRPAAVPLVTVDPYFSVWSMADCLYEDTARHWTGKPNGMNGIILIDEKPCYFMGKAPKDAEVLTQKRLKVEPLTTIYVFEGYGVELQVKFTTPLLPEDLHLASRPVSYINFVVKAVDNDRHKVKIYFDVTAEWCVNTPEQSIRWGREETAADIEIMFIGNDKQEVLSKSGDDIRIDWGYFYLAVPVYKNINCVVSIGSEEIREVFLKEGLIPSRDDNDMPRNLKEKMTVMACTMDFGPVNSLEKEKLVLLAYDDIKSIEYFHKPLEAYWKRTGDNIVDIIKKAAEEYSDIEKRCVDFNRKLIKEAEAAGGKKYADLISLAYRQVMAAHKLVADEDGEVLYFSKECFSNGCIATVDVTYPSIPLFLLYNTEFIKGMLRPIFKYYNSEGWSFDFAPHDVGCYPLANGQVYGENLLKYQMPVEECGNMLITAAAVCLKEKNLDFFLENFSALTDFANYLSVNGFDPGDQLCTDDFAGHLAHNTNLSIKAILGLASYAVLCKNHGLEEKYEEFMSRARKFAADWEQESSEGDHYKLTFDGEGTWSLKYNLIWDKLLNINIFNEEIARKEVKYYLTKQNKYGVPLDSRKSYTKADWIVWSASLAETRKDFTALIEPIWDFINESESRVPFTDWYDTITGKQMNFQHRSVLGGLFIRMLEGKFDLLFLN